MDARKRKVFDISGSPLYQTIERVKRARAKMMVGNGPNAYVFFHREIDIAHEENETCICDPVVIRQSDCRPSLYFAREILYPVLH